MGKEDVESMDPVDSAVKYGIYEILKNNPVFGNNPEIINRYMDSKKLNSAIKEMSKTLNTNLATRNLSDEEKISYLHKNISDYVSSGRAFTDKGQKIILKGSLEEKAKQGGFVREMIVNPVVNLFSKKSDGEKYLDKTMNAFHDLYTLMKSGDYAQRMPELAEATQTIHDMGFLDTSLDILKEYGIIKDERQYNFLKKSLGYKTKEAEKQAVSSIEKYILPQQVQKAAAVVLGVCGATLLFISQPGITGNVISARNLPSLTAGFLGIIFIISGITIGFLTIKGKKKEKKKIISKKKKIKKKKKKK